MFRSDPLANPEKLIRRIYAYVAYRIGDGADAEDVTSEAIERAFRYRKSYDPSKGEPIAWVLGIARRSIDDFFARTRDVLVDQTEAAASDDLEEDTARRLGLSAALGVLGERELELVALRYGADLTARQIGEVLGLRTNAVEVALHRALGRLRAALEESESTHRPSSSEAAEAL
ncbi:MAG: RNA polymerase sigma factor [Gaiellaceae bacterium]